MGACLPRPRFKKMNHDKENRQEELVKIYGLSNK